MYQQSVFLAIHQFEVCYNCIGGESHSAMPCGADMYLRE